MVLQYIATFTLNESTIKKGTPKQNKKGLIPCFVFGGRPVHRLNLAPS
jgi:hypothetical protein